MLERRLGQRDPNASRNPRSVGLDEDHAGRGYPLRVRHIGTLHSSLVERSIRRNGGFVAQWLGQFSGHTHATRVEGAEATLRAAVGSFQQCPVEERARRLKALRKMADQVLRARLQWLKAGLAAAHRIPTAEALGKRATQIERLRSAQEAAVAGGIDAILVEFGVAGNPRCK